ncbi:AraC family transcriptional regulator [Burkholderia sp. Nafp2/4-1b]|uniref:lipoxygenase family protein n=1 Tax=Burkholderia sp. Nafp2/4-1b TaxID=2116686 RepID=UPI000EF94AE8|nr:lipoxygenase family protein [Burkholderia sp. Nafp2/4-1b]RKT99484.1 AraC family transcriptional regulator [Burkholderia sp. Nafp2/4-1b]
MKRRDLLKGSGFAIGAAVLSRGAHAGLLSPSNPVLPQYDTMLGQLARAIALTAAKTNYMWTQNFPFSTGVPMAAGAPVPAGEQPAIDWLLKFAQMNATLLVNGLTAAPGVAPSLAGQFASDLQQLATIQSQLAQYSQTFQQLQNNPLSVIDAASLQTSLLNILTQLGQIETHALSAFNTIIQAQQGNQGGDLSAYNAEFSTLPLPDIANRLRDDDFFGNMRVAGANPLVIRQVTALPGKFALNDSQYQSVMGTGDSLAAAAASRRLYLLDYAEMRGQANPRPGRYITAPIALLALTPARDAMVPVAIQTGQDPIASSVFLRVTDPASPNYWGWQMAKTLVQMADLNHHETCSHLSRTHLVIEAVAVAAHRQLAPSHPLLALMLPHFEGTMYINAVGMPALLAPFGIMDTIFAASRQTSEQTVHDDRLAFDFTAHMLPTDLANRGVASTADLPVYPYRDDALLIWNAITNWVRSYVGVYYQSDADVQGDTELANWVSDVAVSGLVKNFPSIATIEQLVSAVTMILFTTSAQHAAVNFSQWPLWSYVPATPGFGATPLPSAGVSYTQSDWLKMLPSPLVAMAQVNIAYSLSGVFHRPLGGYVNKDFPFAQAITDVRVTGPGGPLPTFRAALTQIESTINARNLQRRYPYTFLLPSRIPTSINI